MPSLEGKKVLYNGAGSGAIGVVEKKTIVNPYVRKIPSA